MDKKRYSINPKNSGDTRVNSKDKYDVPRILMRKIMENLNRRIDQAVRKAICKTINKFREQPYYFFTESDIHSYFYHSLYSSEFTVKKDHREFYLIHREYPTNFRYEKDKMLVASYRPKEAGIKEGARGHYDIAVLNPEYVYSASVEDIVNKDARNIEKRVGAVKHELLFAIEFKYVIKSTLSFIDEVEKDARKLKWAREFGVQESINLVFCNIEDTGYVKAIREFIDADKSSVNMVFVQSYYKKDIKITPKPTFNKSYHYYLPK